MKHPNSPESEPSTAARALLAAGDAESARDVGALDKAARKAAERLGRTKKGLVERLIFGPRPSTKELGSGSAAAASASDKQQAFVGAAISCLLRGEAFTADGKLSAALRAEVAREKAYGFTVPVEFGGLGGSYVELALGEEDLAANGLGPLAVEISGQLTIGAGSLLAYGTAEQKKTFLPLVAEGDLMGFALTEVRIGVNAKKVRAYVEPDEQTGGFRLFAHGDRNKLWITNATHGGLVGLVARIGRDGKQVSLFVARLPERDVSRQDGADHEFWCRSSGSGSFQPNWNSRLHFDNFPLAKECQIQADGVEVLFYCLRMGRCMLAAMAAGYQRMFAADAAHYARQREGVGGKVIRHEMPRLHLGTILGGALQARALSHLALQQDRDGVDLAGLRDLTKSAAADAALRSLISCEQVLGGRSFDTRSRVHEARSNMHAFSIIEGQNDLILMGMVKDVTDAFTSRYLAPMLGVIQSLNRGPDGEAVPGERRVLRIGPGLLLSRPALVLKAGWRMMRQPASWRLFAWMLGNGLLDLLSLPFRLVPSALHPRYQGLPPSLRLYARFAERRLRRLRWSFLFVNLHFQLELTRAQIPLHRMGKAIEHLVSMLALCHHARNQDQSQRNVAALRCEMLMQEVRGMRLSSGLWQMDRQRRRVAAVGDDIENGTSSMIAGVPPQPFAHDWERDS
ncbi:MAG: hypothetical protein Fur0037_20260 [Planctomycetota bacterium]